MVIFHSYVTVYQGGWWFFSSIAISGAGPADSLDWAESMMMVMPFPDAEAGKIGVNLW